MLLGEWGVTLRADTPPEVRDALIEWGHVIITETRLDPRLYADADLLTLSRYTGVLLERDDRGDDKTLRISGASLEYHLGDGDGKSFVYETEREYIADTFANTLNRSGSTPYGLLRDDAGATTAIEPGTIFSVAGTYTGNHLYENQRSAIRYVVDAFSAEYRINPDGTMDAGAESDLFVTTPTAIVVRRDSGSDPNIEAVEVERLDMESNTRDFTTRLLLLAEGTGWSIHTGSADIGANPYKDIHGNALDRTRVISEPDTLASNANSRASLHLGRFDDTPIRRLNLSVKDYDVSGTFDVGDTIYLYDPDNELVDATKSVRFRGRELNPTEVRIVGRTTPIRDGMGVFYRDANGIYVDLSDWAVFESGSIQLEIGEFPQTLTSSEVDSIVRGRVNTNPDGNDSTIPATPALTNTPWGTASYQDDEGRTRAQIIAEWLQPLNQDASTIVDGSHYVVRWRRSGQTEYNKTLVEWGTEKILLLDLSPGVTYEIGVSAVDLYANASAFSTNESVVASVDTTAPSTPAPATVAGNPLYVQVSHDLGKSTGGTFNLEADIARINVYISTTSGFTPGAANFAGHIEANSGHLTLGIDVIGTFAIIDTATRYVKVTAVDRAGNESAASTQETVTATLINTAYITNAAITTAKIGDLQVSTGKIALLAVDTAQIAALAVTNAKINDLDAVKITVGTLDADRIAANSITTAKLIIGSFDNLISDPGFENRLDLNDGLPHEWTDGGGTGWSFTSFERSGQYGARYDVGSQTSDAFLYLNGNPATPARHHAAVVGDKVHLEIWARHNATAFSGADPVIQIQERDEAGGFLANTTVALSGLSTSYQQYTATHTVANAACVYVAFFVQVVFHASNPSGAGLLVDDAYARRQVGTTIIEDDAITTGKIAALAVDTAELAAGAVTAAKIAVGTITANEISSNTITAGEIAATTITANEIVANTITAAEIGSYAPADANSGTFSGQTFRATTGTAFAFTAATTTGLNQTGSLLRMYVSGANQGAFGTTNNNDQNNRNPAIDNTYGLGNTNFRWTDVWAVDGSINTSDETLKTSIGVSPLGLDFIKALIPKQWKWIDTIDTVEVDRINTELEGLSDQRQMIVAANDGVENDEARDLDVQIRALLSQRGEARRPGNRFHHGLGGQQVVDALTQLGVPLNDFAGVIIDSKGTHHLRLGEFIAPITKAIQELDARLTSAGIT